MLEIQCSRKLLHDMQPFLSSHGLNKGVKEVINEAVRRNNVFTHERRVIIAHPVVSIRFDLDSKNAIKEWNVVPANNLLEVFQELDIEHGFSKEFLKALEEHDKLASREITRKMKQAKPKEEASQELQALAKELLDYHGELSTKITRIMTHSKAQACKIKIQED